MTRRSVLIAGEIWTTHSVHQKGFDSFITTEYAEGGFWLKQALTRGGWDITYQPSHVAAREFPATVAALAEYDRVILSDIGANTLLLHPDTFVRGRVLPNRLAAIRDYVAQGGGLIMVGGYLTFQGSDAKAPLPSPRTAGRIGHRRPLWIGRAMTGCGRRWRIGLATSPRPAAEVWAKGMLPVLGAGWGRAVGNPDRMTRPGPNAA